VPAHRPPQLLAKGLKCVQHAARGNGATILLYKESIARCAGHKAISELSISLKMRDSGFVQWHDATVMAFGISDIEYAGLKVNLVLRQVHCFRDTQPCFGQQF